MPISVSNINSRTSILLRLWKLSYFSPNSWSSEMVKAIFVWNLLNRSWKSALWSHLKCFVYCCFFTSGSNYSFSLHQWFRHWNNNPLLDICHSSTESHLDIQPQSRHPDKERSRRRLHSFRGVEEACDGCIGDRKSQTEGPIFRSNGNIHMWIQNCRGNIHKTHLSSHDGR